MIYQIMKVKLHKTKDDKPLGIVDAYVKENTTELDIQIKVSNATTFIEIM